MTRRHPGMLALAGLLLCATPAAAQLGPCAVPVGPLLPDLIMDQHLLETQIFVSEEQFTPSSCAVAEGVVGRGRNGSSPWEQPGPEHGLGPEGRGAGAWCCPASEDFADCACWPLSFRGEPTRT